MIIFIVGILKLGGVLIQISRNEIVASKGIFFEKAEAEIVDFIVMVEKFFGIERMPGENVIKHYLQGNTSFENFGSTINFKPII